MDLGLNLDIPLDELVSSYKNIKEAAFSGLFSAGIAA